MSGIELQRSSNFFKSGAEGGGGDEHHLKGHSDVMPAMALWLTRSHVELFCNAVPRFESPYPEPRVEMFGNEFWCAKTKVSNPSGFNMAAV